MKHMNLRKNMNTIILIAGMIMTASALADTQEGFAMGYGMMGGNGTGWMGGGYGGIWVMILLVAVVAGLIGWIIAKKGK